MIMLVAATVSVTITVFDDDYGPGLPPLSTQSVETEIRVIDADNPINILATLASVGVFQIERFGPLTETVRRRGQYYRVSGQVMTPGNSPVDIDPHTMYMDATGSIAFVAV